MGREAESRGGACLAEHFAEYRESHGIRELGSVTFTLGPPSAENSQSHVVSSTHMSQKCSPHCLSLMLLTSDPKHVWSDSFKLILDNLNLNQS